jgi:hypothetical protein
VLSGALARVRSLEFILSSVNSIQTAKDSLGCHTGDVGRVVLRLSRRTTATASAFYHASLDSRIVARETSIQL